MRNFIKYAVVLFVLTLSAFPMSAAAWHHQPWHPQPIDDIVDTAIKAGDFSTLVAAVQAAGLEEALRGEGPFTVFAPTDAAFEDLLTALDISAEDLLNNPGLADILLYHVVPKKLRSWNLRCYRLLETLSGAKSKVTVYWDWRTRSRNVMINDAMIIIKDIYATNGIIHVIDKVLIPPKDIVDTAAAAGSFNILIAAVQEAGLEEALRGEGPLTVFAPTDSAFEKLLDDLGLTADELLADSGLVDILLYHVVSGEFTVCDALKERYLETLAGEEVKVKLRWSRALRSIVVRVNQSNIVNGDIIAANGIIHVIDKVLLP